MLFSPISSRATRWAVLFLSALIVLPASVSAILITEIMYDAPGSDSGYEWIELYQESGCVNITELRLYENSVNHKIKPYSGAETICSGQFAIIADKPEKFLERWNFSKALFDSSFSLRNSGEQICIKSGSEILDCVEYNSSIGARGDGQSLQRARGWFAAQPTPGAQNILARACNFSVISYSTGVPKDSVIEVGINSSCTGTACLTILKNGKICHERCARIHGTSRLYGKLCGEGNFVLSISAFNKTENVSISTAEPTEPIKYIKKPKGFFESLRQLIKSLFSF